jgi:imidazole glycerol-phosphate synthase subunit HisH
MKKKTIIIDYNSGNLLSVKRAVEYLGFDAEISSDQKKILEADRLIMPGVGHFGFAMKKIEYLRSTILNFLEKKRPFMGICLGMQLLYEKSEEDNFTQKGFEIFKGKVLKFSSKSLIIPHIGWNSIMLDDENKKEKIFSNISENSKFYFVHSFHCADEDQNTLNIYSSYKGNKFISSTIKENIFSFQFHPEKSSSQGLEIYKNFFSI